MEDSTSNDPLLDEAAEKKKAKKAKKKAAEAAAATQEQEAVVTENVTEDVSQTQVPQVDSVSNPPIDASLGDEQTGEKKPKKKKKAKEAESGAGAGAGESSEPLPDASTTDIAQSTVTEAPVSIPIQEGEGGEGIVVEKKKKKKNKDVSSDQVVSLAAENETVILSTETLVPTETLPTQPVADHEPIASENASSIKSQSSSSTTNAEEENETTKSSSSLSSSSSSITNKNDDVGNNTSGTSGNSSSNATMSVKPPKPSAPKPTSPKPLPQVTDASGIDSDKADDISTAQDTASEQETDQPAETSSAVDDSVASSEDDGISRCGVSGLYDGKGNPAALASGWLQILDHKTGRKRHRYYVLCPKYLAYFASEEHAAISEAGFMLGDADYSSLSVIGNNTGANIPLNQFTSVDADPGDDVSTFTINLSQKDGEGNLAVTLVAANRQIALGWSGAVSSQVSSSRTLGKPPNRVKSGPTPMLPEDALAKVAVEASIAVANVVAKSMNSVIKETQRGGFSGLFAQLIGSGKVAGIGAAAGVNEGDKADADYYAFSTWEEKGINLREAQYKSCHEDEYGHPAAILHGWVTKRNKTGVFAGNAMKDRYFVLTPAALCFFPDELSANVREGYMRGKAQGLKISGVFETIGGRLPLESICEIKLLSRFGESNESKRRINVRGRGEDDDDDEEEDEDDGTPSSSTEAIASSIAKRMGGGAVSKSKSTPNADDSDDAISSKRKLSSGNSSITSSPGRKTSNTLVQPIKHPNYDAMREAMLIAECQKRGNVNYEATPVELRQRLLDDDKANAKKDQEETLNYDEMDKQALIELCETRGLSQEGKAKELRVRLLDDDTTRSKKKGSGKKISTMSIDELKEECLRRDLSIDAKAPELRQRLRDDDILRAKKAAAEEEEAAAAAAAAATISKSKKSTGKTSTPESDDDNDDDDNDTNNNEDDDEDDEGTTGIANKKKPTNAKPPPPKKPTGSKPPKPPAAKPSAPPPSNLVEVDFGDFSLIFNAHNTKCRTSWVTQLRQWSAWRKRKLDDELFAGKDE
jgi:hypothetical protein